MAGLSLHYIVLLFMLAWTVQAHTHIRNLIIDGTTLKRGKCIRPYKSNFNFPEKGVDNDEIMCRTTSMLSSSTDICDVKAGSTITLEFHEEESQTSRAIEGKHYGPCLVYMAPLASNGIGDVWFKIYEQGYNPDTKKWCIDTLNKADGKLDVVIPADIADGQYILRGEIIALHLAEKVGGAEFYPNCAQINVVGGGVSIPKGVAIPGVYKEDDSGIHFNLYDGYDSYIIPGPEVYKPEGLLPADDNSAATQTVDPSIWPTHRCRRKRRKRRKRRNIKHAIEL